MVIREAELVSPGEIPVQIMPATRSECWCQPLVEYITVDCVIHPLHATDCVPLILAGEIPVQIMPATRSDQRPHELSSECWCQPLVELIEARIIHRAETPADHGGF